MNEAQQFLQVQQSMTDVQKWIFDVLLALANKQKESKIQDKTIKKLVDHMESGKQCKTWSFHMDDIDFVEKLMKSRGVLYVAMDSVNLETGNPMRTYLFKDSDLPKVKNISDLYLNHLDGKCHELGINTFFAANEGKEFYSAKNLTAAELNVFRDNALKYNMDFVVVRSSHDNKEDRTYEILSNNKEGLEKCLVDTYADLLGNEGKVYLEKMNKHWALQNEMMQKFKSSKEPVFIIDAANLNNVIEVSNNKYCTHRLNVREEKARNGNVQKIPLDEHISSPQLLDKSILGELRHMEKPVVLSKEEAEKYLNVNNRDHDGSFILPSLFATASFRRDFIKQLKEREDLPIKKPLHARDELYQSYKTYTDLPYSVINELKAKKIEGVHIVGRDIAYKPEVEKQVRDVLREVYHKGANPLDIISDELKFKGRGDGKLHGLEKDEAYVLFDYENKDKCIEIIDTKAIILDGDINIEVVPQDFPAYQSQIIRMFDTMQTPIMMRKEDYDNGDRETIAQAMLTDKSGNAAIIGLQTKEEQRMERFYDLEQQVSSMKDNLSHNSLSQEEKDMQERLNRSRVEIINKKNYRGYEIHDEEREERERQEREEREERDKNKGRDVR